MENKCTVVNMRLEQYDVYIGRGSIFGNPFEIGRDGDRDQVIDRYIRWFDFLVKDKVFLSALQGLKGRKLGCFCKQKDKEIRCHGDTIAAYVNEKVGA